VIPLHPIVTDILKENGGVLPHVKCNQVFNRYVKEVCELAGLTEGVILRENVAGKFVVRSLKKCEAVSSHTARRTFATIAYFDWKVPPVLIMKITGHRTEREFFKYIKISKEEAAVEMAAYFVTKQ
jgi:integrase